MTKMINYVVYSHTDYLDILRIQTDYLKSYPNKILLINKNDLNSDIFSEYKNILYYDDASTYATRLLSLSSLDLDYILFIHDNDILLNRDDSTVEYLLQMMIDRSIDRVDFKYSDISDTDKIEVDHNGNKFTLVKQENVYNYIYNVNPSIWKLSTFLEIMNTFRNEHYRTIENKTTQDFCTKYNIYKLHNVPYLRCGYFACLPFFKFLHITNYGLLLPKSNNSLEPEMDQEYQSIINNYLLNGNRPFKTVMY